MPENGKAYLKLGRSMFRIDSYKIDTKVTGIGPLVDLNVDKGLYHSVPNL